MQSSGRVSKSLRYDDCALISLAVGGAPDYCIYWCSEVASAKCCLGSTLILRTLQESLWASPSTVPSTVLSYDFAIGGVVLLVPDLSWNLRQKLFVKS